MGYAKATIWASGAAKSIGHAPFKRLSRKNKKKLLKWPEMSLMDSSSWRLRKAQHTKHKKTSTATNRDQPSPHHHLCVTNLQIRTRHRSRCSQRSSRSSRCSFRAKRRDHRGLGSAFQLGRRSGSSLGLQKGHWMPLGIPVA